MRGIFVTGNAITSIRPGARRCAALALVFAFIFNPRLGIVNALLERFGVPTFQWLDDPFPFLLRLFPWIPGIENVAHVWLGPSVAMMVIIFYSVWTSLGYNIVIYLAGLTAIPRELLEAAKIDGAGTWMILRAIVWPLVTPTTLESRAEVRGNFFDNSGPAAVNPPSTSSASPVTAW